MYMYMYSVVHCVTAFDLVYLVHTCTGEVIVPVMCVSLSVSQSISQSVSALAAANGTRPAELKYM